MLDLTVVDAFTDRPFAGNPAGVAVLDAFPADDWMQRVAREMNLSETAFAVPRPDGGHDLRWFTPTAEVDLCGHATLATAHVLGGSARFHTRSGWLSASALPDGRIQLDFPIDRPTPLDPSELGGVTFPGATVLAVARGVSDILVEIDDAAWLRRQRPDAGPIAALDCRCLVVTAAGDEPGIDFISRVFGPAVGVDEDPVTGSAHCTLGAYWSAKTGRDTFTAFQASPRGGTVGVHLTGDRVTLTGRAVTMSRVQMLVEVPRGR